MQQQQTHQLLPLLLRQKLMKQLLLSPHGFVPAAGTATGGGAAAAAPVAAAIAADAAAACLSLTIGYCRKRAAQMMAMQLQVMQGMMRAKSQAVKSKPRHKRQRRGSYPWPTSLPHEGHRAAMVKPSCS